MTLWALWTEPSELLSLSMASCTNPHPRRQPPAGNKRHDCFGETTSRMDQMQHRRGCFFSRSQDGLRVDCER